MAIVIRGNRGDKIGGDFIRISGVTDQDIDISDNHATRVSGQVVNIDTPAPENPKSRSRLMKALATTTSVASLVSTGLGVYEKGQKTGIWL